MYAHCQYWVTDWQASIYFQAQISGSLSCWVRLTNPLTLWGFCFTWIVDSKHLQLFDIISCVRFFYVLSTLMIPDITNFALSQFNQPPFET